VLHPKNKDVSAYLDNSIQEELTNAGFFKQMKEKYRV
jgi:hypothetical protein